MPTSLQALDAALGVRQRTRAAILQVLARRAYPHTELLGLVRAMVYGPFRGDFYSFKRMAGEKAHVAQVLRCMVAEGDVREGSPTRTSTLYHLPEKTP